MTADFDDLFRAEYPSVVRTVASIVGDLGIAEELTQDAFAAGLVRWRRIGSYDRPGAWIRRVAIRDAVRHLRRNRRDVPAVKVPAPGPESTALDRLEISEAFAMLPPKQRAAAVLSWIEDRPTAEVAALLGCREPTVRVHLHRARAVLGTHLGETPDACT